MRIRSSNRRNKNCSTGRARDNEGRAMNREMQAVQPAMRWRSSLPPNASQPRRSPQARTPRRAPHLFALEDAQRASDADWVERIGHVLHRHSLEALAHVEEELLVWKRIDEIRSAEEGGIALHKLAHLVGHASHKRLLLIPPPRGEHRLVQISWQRWHSPAVA